jgi:hypothetical protein
MRTVFLIITLLLGFIASAQVKLHHTTFNNHKSYSEDRAKFNEDNDCAIRAIATMYDLDYSTALEFTSKYTRESKKGMNAKKLVQLALSLDKNAQHFKVDNFTSRQFAKYIAMPNYDFIVISRQHVHTLIYDKDKDMLVAHGNPMDTNLKIIYAVAIKR